MHLTFIDPNVSQTMNGFLIIANIINIVYNVPQMVQTYKTKSTRDFSSWFLSLRIIGNMIWLVYAFNIYSLLMVINNMVTIISSIFIAYYKTLELIDEYREKRYNEQLVITNDDEGLITNDDEGLITNEVYIEKLYNKG
jgi:uncharacterized protein with PQ loop repeat